MTMMRRRRRFVIMGRIRHLNFKTGIPPEHYIASRVDRLTAVNKMKTMVVMMMMIV